VTKSEPVAAIEAAAAAPRTTSRTAPAATWCCSKSAIARGDEVFYPDDDGQWTFKRKNGTPY
jgi:hypothetical protein